MRRIAIAWLMLCGVLFATWQMQTPAFAACDNNMTGVWSCSTPASGGGCSQATALIARMDGGQNTEAHSDGYRCCDGQDVGKPIAGHVIVHAAIAVHSSRRLSRSLISFPILKWGCVLFGTGTSAPVRGLRPVWALWTLRENVPKPRSSTRLPRASEAIISSNMASTIFSASRESRCGFWCQMRQTRSDLIIPNSP